jgi:hypothetical protein
MQRFVLASILALVFGVSVAAAAGPEENATPSARTERSAPPPPTEPGLTAEYVHQPEGRLPGSVVQSLRVQFGRVEQREGTSYQWLHLHAVKANLETFRVWLLTTRYPSESLAESMATTARYLIQEGDAQALEFSHRFSGKAVLPVLGAWPYLFPHSVRKNVEEEPLPPVIEYLGHQYRRKALGVSDKIEEPPDAKRLRLLPDVLVGMPQNTRQVDETRRYDGSDYTLAPLKENDYAQMIDAGMNCLFVDRQQAKWVENRDVFYWGIGGRDVDYPSCLYRSNYLGPVLFLDEPAVGTRDYVVRPRLAKEPAYRQALTPQEMFEQFKSHFRKAKYEGAPTALLAGLASRTDVQLGNMKFLQQNLYTWETMISSGAFQLTEGAGGPPSFLVFEPPGRIGARRTLPEMDMCYECQLPIDDPNNFLSVLCGFLRGAARASDRNWGISIYGSVDRADAPWNLTHAYDLGAVGFFYWGSYRAACVPFGECLALSRHLRAHAESHPQRDLDRLRKAAEVLVLLPPGYDLGHVQMGRGSLWGLPELNLERVNREGVKYRTVMHNFFTEIERCLRLGVAFDLRWDLPGLDVAGYREVVRVRENGKVEVSEDGRSTILDGPKTPIRPAGKPPQLTVTLTPEEGTAPLKITARARVVDGSAATYYTSGTDSRGVFWNSKVLWELFGPRDEDYQGPLQGRSATNVREEGDASVVEINFVVRRAGTYRLRAATVDMAGRTAVVWKTITLNMTRQPREASAVIK